MAGADADAKIKPPLPLAMWFGLAALLILAWLAFAVWYWLIDTPAGEFDEPGLALRFFLPPVGIGIGVFTFRGWLGWRRGRRAEAAERAAADAERAAAEAAAAETARVAQIRHRRAAVFGFGVATKLGDDPQTVIDALSAQTRAIELETRSLGGIERLESGRIADLASDGEWTRTLAEPLDPSRRLHRMAILLERALAALADSTDLPARTPITIRLYLPSGEHAVAPEAFQPLVTALWRNHPWADAPVQFELPGAPAQGLAGDVEAYVDRLDNEPNLPLTLFLVADSHIDDELLDSLATRGMLALGNRPGMIPGECAAALLLGPPHRAKTLPALAILRRPATVAGPVRNGKRGGNPSALTAAVQTALGNAEATSGAIGTVSCDSDARAARNLEVARMMSACTPELEALQDQLAATAAMGYCGVASPLLAIALAAAFAARGDAPALAVSVAEDALASAMVLTPPPAADPAPG